MANFFNSVRITNFKSLKDVTLSDCKRINLLIGKPNVGKSNILEAIGLFSLPYFQYNKSKKLTQFVRLENIAELFFDGNIGEEISIRADDNSSCIVKYLDRLFIQKESFVSFYIESTQDTIKQISPVMVDEQFNLGINNHGFSEKEVEEIKNKIIEIEKKFNNGIELSLEDNRIMIQWKKIGRINTIYIDKRNQKKRDRSQPKVKYYKFTHDFVFKKQAIRHPYLIPPVGVNLIEAIQESKIDKELADIFAEYGLKLLFDKTNNTLRIMKTLKEENTMVSFPYSSIADTLQRVIFFKTAIASNQNSILLFEEPEAHCFPPYIRQITQDILDSETNQFFIATHSPYVLNDFLEYERNDVAIFIANFKNGETVIRRLTDEEVNDVYQYGIDLFFNHELFTDDQEH
jgi:AAA15 family ATPase/GTPase